MSDRLLSISQILIVVFIRVAKMIDFIFNQSKDYAFLFRNPWNSFKRIILNINQVMFDFLFKKVLVMENLLEFTFRVIVHL